MHQRQEAFSSMASTRFQSVLRDEANQHKCRAIHRQPPVAVPTSKPPSNRLPPLHRLAKELPMLLLLVRRFEVTLSDEDQGSCCLRRPFLDSSHDIAVVHEDVIWVACTI
mmetsp:Transcript_11025/g.30503  ORF Transcript_11025/g.30503 Transcript_11025/m.30503 type:complete len:110 (+) Transcript_11025:3574-3903(+)